MCSTVFSDLTELIDIGGIADDRPNKTVKHKLPIKHLDDTSININHLRTKES